MHDDPTNLSLEGLLAGNRQFDDPFLTPSSDYIPKDLESALDFCLFLYYLNPQYRRASARVIRHFITDFDYPGEGSADEKEQLDEYLTYQLKLPQALAEMGDEWACYGNSFYRVHFPFDRYLIDRRHGAEYALEMFSDEAEFDLEKLEYEIKDPKNPKKKIKLPFRDRMSLNKNRIRLRKLDPRQITIRHNLVSGTNNYIYKFENEIISDVKKGVLHVVNGIPLEMLKTIKNENDFMFNEDEIFHFKSPTISGISNHGWGLPETLANYRSLHLLQVYRKIDEQVAIDYMMPFRLFTPEHTTGESAVVRNIILTQWRSQIETIIKNRRKDKLSMHAIPFPVRYEEFGAQGKQLAPKDLVEYQTNSMLDAMGYPAELFKGSLAVQQVPTSVRLFENSFGFVHTGFNQFTGWVAAKIAKYMGEDVIRVAVSKPSLADNLDRQNIILQLASAGEISRRKAYAFLGIQDPVEERRDRLEEDAQIQKIQQEKEEELRREQESGSINQQIEQMQQQQQQGGGGGGSPPGGPPQGGGAAAQSDSPLDVQEQAREMAQQFLGMPEGDRRKQLIAIKGQNPNLHALIKQFMEEMRSQAGSQGVQQMYQSMQGGG